MDKKESLAFLQSCIDRINAISDEEIAVLQELYALNCAESMGNSDFKIIPPMDIDSCLYDKNEVIEIKISETECVVEKNKEQWVYNIKGSITTNEQSDENLPYAA